MSERIPLEMRILEVEEIKKQDEGTFVDSVQELLYKTGLPEYCRGIAEITGNTALVSEMKKRMPKYCYSSACTLGKYLTKVLEGSEERHLQIYYSLILPFADRWKKIAFEWNWEELDDEDNTPFD